VSEQGGLVPEEGVDEGSAASAVEGAPVTGRSDDGAPDLLGEPPRGAPVEEAHAAGPVDVETDQSRTARAERAPGQQLQEGEG